MRVEHGSTLFYSCGEEEFSVLDIESFFSYKNVNSIFNSQIGKRKSSSYSTSWNEFGK